jgi:hypothetical protein
MKHRGRGMRGDLPRFQDHRATENRMPNKIQRNPKEKERAKKIRVSQTYPPYKNLVLEIWLLREQV